MTLLGYLALGIVAGILGSLLGLGGGILIVPGLTLLFGLPIKTAIATSVVAVVTNSLAGSVVYIRKGFTHIKLAMILEITTTLGALAGGLVAVWVSGRWLYGLFALVAVYMVYAMRRPPAAETADDPDGTLPAAFTDPATGREVRYGVHHVGMGVAVSTVAGVLSSLLGIGGGIIKVPIMCQVMGVPIKAATATSTFMIGITTATAAVVYYGSGLVVPALAIPVALGAVVGAQVGARLGAKIRSKALRTLFQAFLLFIAVQMALRALGL
ncbi:MAG: sulfite exporter TauE/SafE family protein [Anaerolineae bacterium]|nr:sulfite exporter TauE/SafE family protein [Anaerolineae bacterium]